MNSLIFLSVVFIIKLIVADYNKPIVSDIDQIINAITEKKPIKYISNGVELKTTFKRHYFNILDIENEKVYDEVMISEQAFKQNLYHDEDVKVGYKARCNSNDIKLAENYILNYYFYITNLN